MLCEIEKERKEKILMIVLTCWSQIFEFFHKFNFEGMAEACGVNVTVKKPNYRIYYRIN